jgi:hypothetical protein
LEQLISTEINCSFYIVSEKICGYANSKFGFRIEVGALQLLLLPTANVIRKGVLETPLLVLYGGRMLLH